MEALAGVWPHAQHLLVNAGTPGQGAAALAADLCLDSLVPEVLHLVIAELCTIGSEAPGWVRRVGLDHCSC